MNMSVFEMVHSVLGDAKKKMAADATSSGVKTKVAACQPQFGSPARSGSSSFSVKQLSKIADACDYLAENIHSINDTRTPQQKLAEYGAVHEALSKRAFEVGKDAPCEPSLDGYKGEGDKGEHQHQEAPGDSQSPNAPALDSGAPNPGGPNSAMLAAPAMTTGDAPVGGDLGEATSGNQPPKTVVPSEKPYPTSPPNALETNLDMMMPSQPEEVLKQARARGILARITGQEKVALQKRAAAAKQAKVLLMKAAQAGIPKEVALSVLGLSKLGEDALYPAQISAGTDPELQREPGIPSQLSQGAEAGSNTPRETAPNSGEGSGRELLSSNEAAINATKAQAKRQNKSALSEILSEPSMSEATDKALQESLDNTSSAGVKISAAKEMIRKFASASKGNALKVKALAKLAEGEQPMPPAAATGAEGTEPAADPAAVAASGVEGEGDPAVMEHALNAAAAGVTPEDLAQAHALLAASAGGGEAAVGEAQETGEAPPAGVAPAAKMGQGATGGGSSDFGLGSGASGSMGSL